MPPQNNKLIYLGAVDPTLYWNGLYASDVKQAQQTIEDTKKMIQMIAESEASPATKSSWLETAIQKLRALFT